jgi:Domain of unknown function (DUF3560)/Large polyvalent protein associated domain 29
VINRPTAFYVIILGAKHMTTCYNATETAKFVRVALKTSFPGIKFSVKSSRHVINVSWTDGPIDKQVEAVTDAFGGMGFDGMQDMNTYRKQVFNGEEVQFYCYSPYTKRKLSMEFATKIKASLERQNIPCPSLKWSDYYECASFQTQELDWCAARRFNEKVQFFTVENVDTLDFWSKHDGSGCRVEKSDYELLEEVMGIKEIEAAPVQEQEQPTEIDDVFQLDLTEILAARQELLKMSISDSSRELVTVGSFEKPAESEVISHRRSAYQERIDRRTAAAAAGIVRHRNLSDGYYNRSHSMTSCIPFGQPILVGHHSEGRDRRYRAKAWNMMGKSVSHSDTASYYEDKLQSIETNTAISSDDPDAIAKLKRKIEAAELSQERMKEANKIIKSAKLSTQEKVLWLQENGHEPSLLTGDYIERIGYAGYQLSNNNANIRSMKLRLVELEQQLQRAEQADKEETDCPELGLKVVQNNLENRVQIVFPGKPSETVRSILKANGFKWAPSQGAWQRKQGGMSGSGLYWVLQQLGKLGEIS